MGPVIYVSSRIIICDCSRVTVFLLTRKKLMVKEGSDLATQFSLDTYLMGQACKEGDGDVMQVVRLPRFNFYKVL